MFLSLKKASGIVNFIMYFAYQGVVIFNNYDVLFLPKKKLIFPQILTQINKHMSKAEKKSLEIELSMPFLGQLFPMISARINALSALTSSLSEVILHIQTARWKTNTGLRPREFRLNQLHALSRNETCQIWT